MAVHRTKSVGTKVTENEYATLEALAAGRRLSEWVREVLLTAATPRPTDQILLAEFLALRTVLLNLHFAVSRGEPMTAEAFQRLIDRADQDKIRKALARFASRPGSSPTP